MKQKTFLLSLLFCLMFFEPALSQVYEADSLALLQILQANCQDDDCLLTDSTSGYFWNTADNMVGWGGVEVSPLTGRITELHLNSRGLKGILPSLDSLTELTTLNLSKNDLEGFDSQFLPNLTTLNILNNSLRTLPAVGSFPVLTQLNCTKNDIPTFDLEQYSWLASGLVYNPQNYFPNPCNVTFQSNTYSPQVIDFVWLENTFDACSYPSDINLQNLFSAISDSVYLIGQNPPYFLVDSGWCFPQNFTITSDYALPADSFSFFRMRYLNQLLGFNCEFYIQRYLTSLSTVCGDVNQDGIRTMADLFPISLFWNKNGPRRNITIQDTVNTPQPTLLWPDSAQANNQIVNGCYSDCNGDGEINYLDLNCIRENYTRLSSNLTLTSTIQDTVGLVAIPQDQKITTLSNGDIRIPFLIELDQLPQSLDSVLLRGVIFARGVAETPAYQVDTIFGDLSNSDFANNEPNTVGMQVFHDTLVLDSSHLECLDIESKQLDVGLFRGDKSVWLESGDAVLECIVIIHPEDNLLTTLPDSIIPVSADVNSVVMYLEDSNGNFFEVAASCTSDTTILFTDSLLNQTVIAGTITTPTGLPVEHVDVDGYDGVKYLSDSTKSSGDYTLTVPFATNISVTPTKALASNSKGHISPIDLNLLAIYLYKGIGLNDYQKVAADVDGDGLLTIADYVAMRNVYDGVATSLPIGKWWVFIDADSPLQTSPTISYSDERYYQPAYRNYGQDYTAVLLGDLDQSWGTSNTGNKQNSSLAPEFSFPVLQSPYPNPANDYLNIPFYHPDAIPVHWELFDLNGQLLGDGSQSHPGGEGKFILDLKAPLPGNTLNGLCLLKLRFGEVQKTFKIMIRQ